MLDKLLKMRSKKGFTLMEMLIVVAIIAILVAIAIPTFSSALTKARVSADLANVRAYYAEVLADHLLEGKNEDGTLKAYPGGDDAAVKALKNKLNYPKCLMWTVTKNAETNDSKGDALPANTLYVTYDKENDKILELELVAEP